MPSLLSSFAIVACLAHPLLSLPTNMSPNLAAQLLRRGAPGEASSCSQNSCKSKKQTILSAVDSAAGSINGSVSNMFKLAALATANGENGADFDASQMRVGGGSDGQYKEGYSAELSVYRFNWGMASHSEWGCDGFKDAKESDWYNRGQELHHSVPKATKCFVQLWNNLNDDPSRLNTGSDYFGWQRAGDKDSGLKYEYGNWIRNYVGFYAKPGTVDGGDPELGEHAYDDQYTWWDLYSM